MNRRIAVALAEANAHEVWVDRDSVEWVTRANENSEKTRVWVLHYEYRCPFCPYVTNMWGDILYTI